MYRIHIYISGKVQGVWFRKCTQDIAHEMDILGWVKNRQDGQVEIMAEGSMGKLTEFTGWLQTGSPQAKVDTLKVTWAPSKDEFSSFELIK